MVDNTYHVSGAKALIGACFIQYLFYAVMYIIEGFKLQEFEETGSAKRQSSPPRHRQEESKQVEEGEGKPTDLRDIALDDNSKQDTETRQQESGETMNASPAKPAVAISDTAVEEDEDYEFENMHFLPFFVKSYQKSTIWFTFVLAIACLRGAVGFVIAFGYIQFCFRIMQFIGTIFKKRMISRIGYGGATLCIVIMFFGLLIDEHHMGTY